MVPQSQSALTEAALGVYKDLPVEEITRLLRYKYPNQATINFLNENSLVKEAMICSDLGAGPNPGMAEYFVSKGCDYNAIDSSEPMLLELRKQLNQFGLSCGTHKADVTDLSQLYPAELQPSANISLLRFVLAHMLFEDQLKALREASRITSHALVVGEHNWEPFLDEHKSYFPEHLTMFKARALEFLQARKIDPACGSKVFPLMREALGSRKYRFEGATYQRGPGNYSLELHDLARAMAASAQKCGNDDLENEMSWIAEQFITRPVSFTPPAIVICAAIFR